MLPPVELAQFEATPDGNLKVTLERFGRLTIHLPNSPQTIEVMVTRDKEKKFGCFVVTDLHGDPKNVAAATKRNKGVPPQVTHRLLEDGTLFPEEETQPKAQRDAGVGKAAAEAAEDGPADGPAETEESAEQEAEPQI